MSSSAQHLEAALAGCLDDLQAGLTPAQCLARYPEYADQLGPLLLTAERLQSQVWPALSTSGRVRGRERMHAALASRRPTGFDWWSVLKPLASALVLLVLAGGVWLAWPGRLTKNISPPTSAPVVASATPAPPLTVGPTATQTLTVTPTPTETSGAIAPVPTEADVPEMFEGRDATRMPFATATLRTRSTATSGARVSTPEPTQTASLGGPQQTPRNEATPKATIEVTEAPRASVTREPTATRKPTETREPTESPRPPSTPRPASTAEPSEPPHATATRASTETPEPSKTPESTDMPQSSETSEPTKTPDHD